MKICGISDIHGDLNINIPECDVLCICGDVINLNDQRDMPASKKWWESRFIKWIEKLPCKKIIVVPGNHDFYLYRMHTQEVWSWFKDRMRLLSNFKIEFLLDELYEYEGITFYGTPWINSIDFQEGRWAFERNFNEAPIEIPNCNILLTHDNPFENEHIRVSNTTAQYHLFGHWHDGEDDSLRCRFNCSILDDMYNRKKKFKCVIIDIMTEAQKKKIEQDFLKELLIQIKCDPLFTLPSSNIIDEHNKKIISLLESFEDEDGPVLEDTIPWEHPMKDVDSAIITDFNNQIHNPDVILGDGLFEQITHLKRIKITDDIYLTV